jgi:hypothetical protein
MKSSHQQDFCATAGSAHMIYSYPEDTIEHLPNDVISATSFYLSKVIGDQCTIATNQSTVLSLLSAFRMSSHKCLKNINTGLWRILHLLGLPIRRTCSQHVLMHSDTRLTHFAFESGSTCISQALHSSSTSVACNAAC